VTIELELQIASNAKTLPHPSQFREWISIVLWNRLDEAELTIRIVDEEEIASLNEQYRHKQGPTNVLSFVAEHPDGLESSYLGDIIVCAPIVEREAMNANKDLLAHWALMVIHGTLHLLGYDHEDVEEAEEMENLETEILVKLGFAPPYGETTDNEQDA